MNPQEKTREPDSASQFHSASPGNTGAEIFPAWPPAEGMDKIKIGKTVVFKDPATSTVAEVFTMTLGNETIQLLPLKHWTQLDSYKWRARGLLPRTPAGLEITWERVKLGTETVSPWETDACAKLEKAFEEWLQTEKQALEQAKQKAQAPVTQAAPQETADEVAHFQIEMGPLGHPRLKCIEGRKIVKTVALNVQGLNALIEQGLMRRPQSLKAGVLHDWIELDGRLFRFKEGTDWTSQLEKFINERYVVGGEGDAPRDVEVFANPASPTGFDIQFAAAPNGFLENRKRHLNEETVKLLADPERCHLLRKGVIAKFSPPNLIFKRETLNGGECYLESGPEATVYSEQDDGQTKAIDLSQPISLLSVGVRDLNAIFNHPAINRRAHLAQNG